MKFTLKGPLKDNIYSLMKSAGYFFEGKNTDGEMNFARPSRGYPRFHIYLKIEEDIFIFNLHLDQKKPVYQGARAHSGEYSGDTVEGESERIKQIFKN